jgi:hypothetical protein
VSDVVETSDVDGSLIGAGYEPLGTAEVVGVVLYKFNPVTFEVPELVTRGVNGGGPLENPEGLEAK